MDKNKKEITFPLVVGIVIIFISFFIIVYLMNSQKDVKANRVRLANGFTLIESDGVALLDDDGLLVLAPDVVEINYNEDYIFYKRKENSKIEVGKYDVKRKHIAGATNESYKKLESEYKRKYNIKLIKVQKFLNKKR